MNLHTFLPSYAEKYNKYIKRKRFKISFFLEKNMFSESVYFKKKMHSFRRNIIYLGFLERISLRKRNRNKKCLSVFWTRFWITKDYFSHNL